MSSNLIIPPLQVNNAAIVYFEAFDDFRMDHYHDVMQVNLHSVVQLTKLAVPHLKKTEGDCNAVFQDLEGNNNFEGDFECAYFQADFFSNHFNLQ